MNTLKTFRFLVSLVVVLFTFLFVVEIASADPPPSTISVSAPVSGYTVNASGDVHSQSADLDSNWTVSVNWGDGSATTTGIVITNIVHKDGDWASSHSYASVGTYTINVYLLKLGDEEATNSTSVTVSNPVPVLTSISPSSADLGGPAFTLTLTGSNFGSGSTVKWNGSARTTSYASSTELTADILASDIATAGTASVTVFNPTPGGGTSAPQTFTVTKATPTIVWTPTNITYGTGLGLLQLNATTSPTVLGDFDYTPYSFGEILSAGIHILTTLFTPTDGVNYNSASSTASVTVNKADPGIVWVTPADITLGTALDETQLNATTTLACPTCTLPGALTYSPISGTVLSAGTHTLTVTAAETANYNTATSTVEITVLDVTPPVIDAHGDITGVEATSPSGATVTFTVNSTDDVDGTLPALCTPSSESTFALGTTLVECTQTDSSGNIATSTSFSVTVVDTTAPVIALLGSDPQTVLVNEVYEELGATVDDTYDTGLIATIDASTVDTGTPGSYAVTYDAVDSSGNNAVQVIRTVNVVDQEEPVITLEGADPQEIEVYSEYVELGATVADNHDIGLEADIDTSEVDTDTVGSYTVTYDAVDSSGNNAIQVTRTVNVVDTTAPVITITLDDDAHNHLKVGDPAFADPGATATDNYDSEITVTPTGTVNTAVAGTYPIDYNAVDSSGNSATTSTRSVVVRDLGTDATLSELTISAGTLSPVFASSTFAYTVILPYGATTTPETLATTTDQYATTTTTNATDVTSATTTDRTTTVTVTAEDDIATNTYTIVFSVTTDTVAPIITVLGTNPAELTVGASYTDAGATATDDIDGDLTAQIVTTSSVNTGVAGSYTVTYVVNDAAMNYATSTRNVNVSNPAPAPAPGGGGGGGVPLIGSYSGPVVNSTSSSATTTPLATTEGAPVAPASPTTSNTPEAPAQAPEAFLGAGAPAGDNLGTFATGGTITPTAAATTTSEEPTNTTTNEDNSTSLAAVAGIGGLSRATTIWAALIVFFLFLASLFIYKRHKNPK